MLAGEDSEKGKNNKNAKWKIHERKIPLPVVISLSLPLPSSVFLCNLLVYSHYGFSDKTLCLVVLLCSPVSSHSLFSFSSLLLSISLTSGFAYINFLPTFILPLFVSYNRLCLRFWTSDSSFVPDYTILISLPPTSYLLLLYSGQDYLCLPPWNNTGQGSIFSVPVSPHVFACVVGVSLQPFTEQGRKRRRKTSSIVWTLPPAFIWVPLASLHCFSFACWFPAFYSMVCCGRDMWYIATPGLFCFAWRGDVCFSPNLPSPSTTTFLNGFWQRQDLSPTLLRTWLYTS